MGFNSPFFVLNIFIKKNKMKKLVLSEGQYKKLKNTIIERSIINEQSKSQIMIIQQRLIDCFGANLGKGGPNKDGVDGIAGDKTKLAIETYTKFRFDGSKPDEVTTDDSNLIA